MRHVFRHILLAVALSICSASLALGASVTITPAGEGSFAVQGDNMNGVSGIELTIGYDTSALTSPTVSWGGLIDGALSIANTTVPGSIRIAIIRTSPFSGSGQIAALSFDARNGSGGITSVSAKMTDINGVNIPAQPAIAPAAAAIASSTIAASAAASASPAPLTTPGIPFSQPAATRTPPAAAASTAVPVPSGLGTVTLPGVNQANSNEARQGEPKAVPPPEASEAAAPTAGEMKQPPAEKSAEAIAPAVAKQTVYGSVLDHFRTYQGERSPKNLLELFTKAVSPSIRQDPAVAISDGTATVRVTVDLSATKGTSTVFALTGARMVSLNRKDESGTWVLDALPKVNSLKATVTATNSGSVVEFPLTVVPPAPAVSAKQADFAAFLKDGGARVPKHDLNGDGRHDYQDDFIYTAHYLIKSGSAAKDVK